MKSGHDLYVSSFVSGVMVRTVANPKMIIENTIMILFNFDMMDGFEPPSSADTPNNALPLSYITFRLFS